MKNRILALSITAALPGAAHAEPGINYGYVELSYLGAPTDSTFFIADDTESLSLDTDYKPDGLAIEISVPVTDSFFYQLGYSSRKDDISEVSFGGTTYSIDASMKIEQVDAAAGYIYRASPNLALHIKGTYANGEVAEEDFDSYQVGVGFKFKATDNIQLFADAGIGEAKIDEKTDMMEVEVGALYEIDPMIAFALSYNYTEFDKIKAKQGEILLGIEELQTVKASVRIQF